MILKMKSLSLAVHESNWIEQTQEFRQITVIFLVIPICIRMSHEGLI